MHGTTCTILILLLFCAIVSVLLVFLGRCSSLVESLLFSCYSIRHAMLRLTQLCSVCCNIISRYWPDAKKTLVPRFVGADPLTFGITCRLVRPRRHGIVFSHTVRVWDWLCWIAPSAELLETIGIGVGPVVPKSVANPGTLKYIDTSHQKDQLTKYTQQGLSPTESRGQ